MSDIIAVRVSDLCVGYGKKQVLGGLNFSLGEGKILCLLGQNGGGKSTVLRTLSGMLPPLGGEVFIKGKKLSDYSPKELSKLLAVVLTEPLGLQMTTAFEVALAGRLPFTDFFGTPNREDRKIALEALVSVGALHLAARDFSGLSDGEKQKVMIARALAQQPRIMILDEPTSHLDIKHRLEMVEILKRMAHERKLCVILAIHDVDLAMKVADEVMLIKDGKVADYGGAEALWSLRMEDIYEIRNASYQPLLGVFELHSPLNPRVLVISKGESGVPVYRLLASLGMGAYIFGPQRGEVDFAVAAAMHLEFFPSDRNHPAKIDLIIYTDEEMMKSFQRDFFSESCVSVPIRMYCFDASADSVRDLRKILEQRDSEV